MHAANGSTSPASVADYELRQNQEIHHQHSTSIFQTRSSITSPEYAERLARLTRSHHPFFNNQHLRPLIKFLRTPSTSSSLSLPAEAVTKPLSGFVHQYDVSGSHIGSPRSFDSPEDFLSSRQRSVPERELIFLSGHPSSAWLNCLGQTLNVPAEFWTRHLDFLATEEKEKYVLRGAHTSAPQIISFDIPSLISCGQSGRFLSQVALYEAQRSATRIMDERLAGVRTNRVVDVGKPMVRALHVQRGHLLSIEQRITMTLLPRGTSSSTSKPQWTVLAYCDASSAPHDLKQVLDGMDHFDGAWAMKFCPIGFASSWSTRHVHRHSPPAQRSPDGEPALTHLAADYGCSVVLDERGADAFDVLEEILHVAICGTAQLLTALEQIIEDQLKRFSLPKKDVLEYATSLTFNHHRGLLQRHVVQLNSLQKCLRTKGGRHWDAPAVADEDDDQWSDMFEQATDLLEQAQGLLRKCDHGEELVRAKHAADDMDQSSQRATAIGKLTQVTTFVTIFWVPLSFLSSIFGMNFRELNSGTLSIWVWAACSLPCAILSIIALAYMHFRSKRKPSTRKEANRVVGSSLISRMSHKLS